MTTLKSPASTLHIVGGALCLDFTNTTGGRETDTPNERLRSYVDLVAWGERVGTLTSEMASQLAAEAHDRPGDSAATLQRAVALREALYRLFVAQVEHVAPQPADLPLFNWELGEAFTHLQLRKEGTGYVWAWEAAAGALDCMLWPVVRSAADLLLSDELCRVRKCAADQCDWLFVDRSKNRSRRWCDMQDCGNVAKVRRYRDRHQPDTED